MHRRIIVQEIDPPLRAFLHPKDGARSLAYCPDGRQLAVGNNIGTILLWNLESGETRSLVGHQAGVNVVAFSPDGTRLASGGDDGSLMLQDVKSGEVSRAKAQDRACRIANRNLSAKEWAEFIGHDLPYQRTCANLPPGEGAR